MSIWSKRELPCNVPGIFGYSMTIISFAFAALIAVVLTPFANFYLYTNELPNSDERQQIYDNLSSDAWGVVLSSVTGLIFALVVVFTMKFGRYFALAFTLVEQIILAAGLSYLSIWLMWKDTSSLNTTLLTMLPFALSQLAAYITTQLMVLFGQGGKVLYNLMAQGAILGAFIGVSRTIQQNYFYFGGVDTFGSSAALGEAFGKSVLDTSFYFGSCSLAAACIARSKAGGSILWQIPAFILPIGLACTFSMYIELADYVPVISSTAGRYVVGALVAIIANIAAFTVFYPIKKQPENANGRNKNGTTSANTSVGGPIAVNAVYVV